MRLHLLGCALALWGCGDSGGTPSPERLRPDLFTTSDLLPSGCSPTSCTGSNCCQGTLTSQCVAGATVAACGYGGNPCQVCKSGDQCQDGTCRSPTCDKTSCPKGCCDSTGACKPGTTDDACGSAGAECKACDSGASQVCMSNKCAVKGTGSYQVILVGCTIDQSWGGVCGMESNCDAYVVLTVGKTKGQSSIKLDVNTPLWNEQLLNATEAEITASFDIEVYDDDYGPDDQLAGCSWKVTSADIAAGKIVQHCGGAPSNPSKTYVKDLTFELKPL